MNSSRAVTRRRFRSEMAIALGTYDPRTDSTSLAGQPTSWTTPEEYAVIHENIHRVLTWGTLHGAFQRFTHAARAKASPDLAATIEQIDEIIMDGLVATHEATASYVELCMCALYHDDVDRLRAMFPRDYVDFLEAPLAAFDIPRSASVIADYQWIAAVAAAKVALNDAVLETFDDPRQLNVQRFRAYHMEHAPDLRFRRLCSAVRKRGGLRWLVPAMSDIIAAKWQDVRHERAPLYDIADGLRIVDLREAGSLVSPGGNLIAEHAEHAVMALVSSCLPELSTRIGRDVMARSAQHFMDGWQELLQERRGGEVKPVKVMISEIDDEVPRLRQRVYQCRYLLEGCSESITLDDLRHHLDVMADRDDTTLVTFIETVNREVAIIAASYATHGSAPERKIESSPRSFRVARMAIEDVLDFALLSWTRQGYAKHTAWHLPLELAYKHGFPNVAVGIHGALLRSWPVCEMEKAAQIARRSLTEGKRICVVPIGLSNVAETKVIVAIGSEHLHVRMQDPNSKAIVIQIIDGRPWLQRLPCDPSFTAWLGTGTDFDGLEASLSQHREIRWGKFDDAVDKGVVALLISAAYNLPACLGDRFPFALVPDRGLALD